MVFSITLSMDSNQKQGFGGIASGPSSLQELHTALREVLDKQIGQPLSVTSIVDMMNLIGRCVVSANVR